MAKPTESSGRGERVHSVDELNQQSETDRRAVRSDYFGIQSRISEGRDDIGSVDSDTFMKIMYEVEDLHHKVKKPREQVADAEALLGITSTLVDSVKSHSSGNFSVAEFISCLLREFEDKGTKRLPGFAGNRVLWKILGLEVSNVFKNGKGCLSMIGPMRSELKHRTRYTRKKRTRPSSRAQPKKFCNPEEEKTDTDKNMATIFEILREKKSVKLEYLLLNRISFAQTVENLFALSFLVKDGRVSIEADDKGSHFVAPRNAPAAKSVISGEVNYHPFVFRFDFADWKLMLDLVPKGEELMPHRGVLKNPTYSKPESVPQNDSQEPSLGDAIKKLSKNRMQFSLQNYVAVENPLIGSNDHNRKLF